MRMRRYGILSATLVIVLATQSLGATIRTKPNNHPPGVPHFNHVFLIIGENTSASDVNMHHTPYLFGTLMPQGGTLTNYLGLQSGSLANYIGMTAGHYQKCEINDSLPYYFSSGKPKCTEPGASIFSQLDGAGISWTQWSESMPNPCGFVDEGMDWTYNVFTTHHNPAVYFDSIEGRRYSESYNQPPAAECIQRVLPMGTTAPSDTTAFDLALAEGTVPQFNFVVPNDCDDGHDLCGASDRYHQFDNFLVHEVPQILASPAFGSDGLILITYDEWSDSTVNNKRVAFVALGPLVTPGSTSTADYSHYSLLRTLEEGYGLRPYLGGADKATAITGIWGSSR
jgi:phosphatidylinositol-3-phosphatase